MALKFEIRVLDPRDDRRSFNSHDDDLDRFFHRYAGQNQFRHHIGVTYVAVDESGILGFVTVAPSEIQIDDLPAELSRRLPRYPLPVLRIARLAVTQESQGQGVGRALLRFALRLARRMSGEVGCVGVVVDAKLKALDFYARYGFEAVTPLEGALQSRPEPRPLFLPISAVPEGC